MIDHSLAEIVLDLASEIYIEKYLFTNIGLNSDWSYYFLVVFSSPFCPFLMVNHNPAHFFLLLPGLGPHFALTRGKLLN